MCINLYTRATIDKYNIHRWTVLSSVSSSYHIQAGTGRVHGYFTIDSVPSQYLVDYVNVRSANENGPFPPYLLNEIQIRNRRV